MDLNRPLETRGHGVTVRLVEEMSICQNLVTKYEYGTRLREDSSRQLVKGDLNLKLISRKIGVQDIESRLLAKEFDLVQKITSTSQNRERMVQQRYFKKFFGVKCQFGPYRVNLGECAAGANSSHLGRREGHNGKKLFAREHDPEPVQARRQEQLHRHAEAGQ